jgi:hypothetical protein
MSDNKAGTSVVGIVALAALLVAGCGSPPGAGTINMAAIKEAATKRAIPEAKTATPAVAKNNSSKADRRVRGPMPTQALPKGGR